MHDRNLKNDLYKRKKNLIFQVVISKRHKSKLLNSQNRYNNEVLCRIIKAQKKDNSFFIHEFVVLNFESNTAIRIKTRKFFSFQQKITPTVTFFSHQII